MPEKNARVFRTAVNGFNKADVLSYLEKMNADFKSEAISRTALLAEKDKTIAELQLRLEASENRKDEIAELKKSCAELRERVKTAEAKYEDAAAVATSQSEMINDLKVNLENCKVNTVTTAEMEEMSAKLAEYETKAKQYDDISLQLGSLIIQARKHADDITAEAEAEGAKIVEKADYYAQNMRKLLANTSYDITVAVQSILKKLENELPKNEE